MFWIECRRNSTCKSIVFKKFIDLFFLLWISLSHHYQHRNQMQRIVCPCLMMHILVHRIDETQSIPSQLFTSLSLYLLFNRIQHHQQTLKEMKEVLRCVEVSQREFVDTIEVCAILIRFLILKTYFFSVNTRYKSSPSII